MSDVKKKFIKNETVVLDKDVEVPPETNCQGLFHQIQK